MHTFLKLHFLSKFAIYKIETVLLGAMNISSLSTLKNLNFDFNFIFFRLKLNKNRNSLYNYRLPEIQNFSPFVF